MFHFPVINRLARLAAIAVVFSAIVMFVVLSVHAQDAEAPPVWRTLIVSNSTPAVGQQTEVFFEVGNRSAADAWLGGVACAVQKRAPDGSWVFSTDLRPVSVIGQDGFPLVFFWGEGPLYIVTSIPSNLLLSGEQRSFRVLYDVIRNTDSENFITCGVEYALTNGLFGNVRDTLYVGVWEVLPGVTSVPEVTRIPEITPEPLPAEVVTNG